MIYLFDLLQALTIPRTEGFYMLWKSQYNDGQHQLTATWAKPVHDNNRLTSQTNGKYFMTVTMYIMFISQGNDRVVNTVTHKLNKDRINLKWSTNTLQGQNPFKHAVTSKNFHC